MIDKVKIIYKGDKLMALYYMGLGVFLIFAAVCLFLFTSRIGWFSLAIGLSLFGMLCACKGFIIYNVAKQRYAHYDKIETLSLRELKEEIDYNQYRLNKKAQNRPRYIYGLVVCFILLLIGMAIQQKGYTIGILVPIMFYTGTEIAVTLLTEFRLWEYQRQLEKEMNF
jgi:hypothetical protein